MDDFLFTILLYDLPPNKGGENCWHLLSEELKHNFWTNIKKNYMYKASYIKTVSLKVLCTCVPACRRWESISDREKLNILSSPSRKLFLRLFQNSLFLWLLQWHRPLQVHITHWKHTTLNQFVTYLKGKWPFTPSYNRNCGRRNLVTAECEFF